MTDRAPALGKVSFACPHCGAFTSQTWFSCRAREIGRDDAPPRMPDVDAFENALDYPKIPAEEFEGLAAKLREWRDGMRSGMPILGDRGDPYTNEVPNVFFSKCFACSKVAAWMGDVLVVPKSCSAPMPHAEMPLTVLPDFQEARSIVSQSPRGAAALLRLCVQKICVALRLPGKDLNKDIGTLVELGLPIQVQQALDAVRVIGNESVHPGELDMKDDQAAAEHLFELVNMVVEDRIAKPKALAALYARLPQSKRDGIEQRDAPKALKT